MGVCGSSLTEDQKAAIAQSTKLDKVLDVQNNEEVKIVKLLLLGTGESGKSTIFKQMQLLYQEGFTDFEKATFKSVVRRNVLEAMQTLLAGVEKFDLRLSSHGAQEAAKYLLSLDPLNQDATVWGPELINYIKMLWSERALKQAYENKSRLQLLDSTEYLLTNIGRIGAAEYAPTSDDILRARLRTSGVVERTFRIREVDFKFLDVGGQRSERRKWLHCFEGVTAVMFIAAISEYDQVLYEDEKENRLLESVKVFETVANNKFFEKTAIILFLNKVDIFQEKIKNRIPLKTCFSDFNGRPDVFDDNADFVRSKFLEQNKQRDKMIFAHYTCATDSQNVERVFDACKVVILKDTFGRLGLA